VLLSGIVRDSSGKPIELAAPIEVASEVARPSQVSWVDQTTVAVVNSTPDFTNAVLVSVGGTSRIISAPPNTKLIVAVGVSSQLYLLSTVGELYRFTGSSWALIRSDVKALTIVN
jgi:Lipoprotein LpqB beta-propeller domain.